jgi:hypothetical protein
MESPMKSTLGWWAVPLPPPLPEEEEEEEEEDNGEVTLSLVLLAAKLFLVRLVPVLNRRSSK